MTQDELRVIGMAGPSIINMLRAREERIISKIYGEFRNGKTDHLCAIAELACVRDQINELENAIRQLNKENQR